MPNSASTKGKVEELNQDTDVQKVLEQTTPHQETVIPPAKRKRKFFYSLLPVAGPIGHRLSASSRRPSYCRDLLPFLATVLFRVNSDSNGSRNCQNARHLSDQQSRRCPASEYNIRRILNLVIAIVIGVLRRFNTIRELVHSCRFVRTRFANSWLCLADSDNQFYWLDLHTNSHALSLGRPHSYW
jgi:hypothetical protein